MDQLTFWWAVLDLFVLVWMVMLMLAGWNNPATTKKQRITDFLCVQVSLLVSCTIVIELVGYIKQ